MAAKRIADDQDQPREDVADRLLRQALTPGKHGLKQPGDIDVGLQGIKTIRIKPAYPSSRQNNREMTMIIICDSSEDANNVAMHIRGKIHRDVRTPQRSWNIPEVEIRAEDIEDVLENAFDDTFGLTQEIKARIIKRMQDFRSPDQDRPRT